MVTHNPEKGTPKVDQFAFVLPNPKVIDKNIFVGYDMGLSGGMTQTCNLISPSNSNPTYNRKSAIETCDQMGSTNDSSIDYNYGIHRCTALIVCNDFKIPKDYPYKF